MTLQCGLYFKNLAAEVNETVIGHDKKKYKYETNCLLERVFKAETALLYNKSAVEVQ